MFLLTRFRYSINVLGIGVRGKLPQLGLTRRRRYRLPARLDILYCLVGPMERNDLLLLSYRVKVGSGNLITCRVPTDHL